MHDSLPEGALVIGGCHTHGDYSRISRVTGSITRTSASKDVFNSDNFSRSDLQRYNQIYDDIRTANPQIKGLNWMGYLGTPSGVFKAYNTATGVEYEL